MFNARYTFVFKNKPTQDNFKAIAGEVIWDTVFEHSPNAAYTQSFTDDSVTLVFEQGDLALEVRWDLLHKLADLAEEFA